MRAKQMQKLTDEIKARHPGVVIYGIGDDAHKTRISDHNEDDTPGVRAEQSDADNIPEHRAIDVMLGPHFNRSDALDLIDDLTSDEDNRPRMNYIIFDGHEYTRSNNYEKDSYKEKDQHEDHVHISGRAAYDDNPKSWLEKSPEHDSPGAPDLLGVDGILGPHTIKRWQQIMGTTVDGVISDPKSELIFAVQRKLKAVDHRLEVDGELGRKTISALQRYLKSPVDGIISQPKSLVIKALQRRLNQGKF